MKNEILSLKNLYKFLTTNDYPVYSDGIIRKERKRGLTLNQFCDENILVDFKERKSGKIIWRMDGSRNRYVSEMCNRNGEQAIYKEYAKEVLAAADQETVLRQIRQLMSFLLERQYNAESFWRKIEAYIELLEKEDTIFTKEVAEYFKKAIQQYKGLQMPGIKVNAFCVSWFVSYFILFAVTANKDAESFVHKIKGDKEFTLLCMLKRYSEKKQSEVREVTFLTGNNTELSRKPLGVGHFFGRQTELFEMSEFLGKGGKYLVSGMGGSGKTELMRQFLRICMEERSVDCVGIVQYEGGLARSMVKAFPGIVGSDLAESYQEVLARIRMSDDKKVLLIIDNMDSDVDEGELDALCKLPVTIFVTSRSQKLNGFETYRLHAIGKEAGRLIFCDNYGSYLSESDKEILEDIVNEDIWCHTLTLRLLAKTAQSNGWNLAKLKKELCMSHTPAGYTETEKYENLKQVYQQMYGFTRLLQGENSLLRAMAALPYQNYEIGWIQHYMKDFLPKKERMEESLEHLWLCGWLEKSETGYSMHPLISECVLSTPLQEKEISPFLDAIILEWKASGEEVGVELLVKVLYEHEAYVRKNAELVDTTMLLQTVLEKISGKLEDTYTKLYLIAMGLEVAWKENVNGKLVKKLQAKEKKFTRETQIGLFVVHATFDYLDIAVALERFWKFTEDATISMDVTCSLAHELATRLFCVGRSEEALELYDFLLEHSQMENHQMAGCLGKAQILMQKADFVTMQEWLQKGIAIGMNKEENDDKYMYALLATYCSVLIALGNYEEGEKRLIELEKMSQQSYYRKMMFCANRGLLELVQGKEGFGVEDLEESVVMAEVIYHDNVNPAETIAPYYLNLANAYGKNQQYENAEAIYHKTLALYENISGYEYNKRTLLNNLAVLYLDNGKVEKAMKYLPRAYEMSEQAGGICLGESAYNYSRVYQMLGDREKELEYLQEATPILEQFYGETHPKVVDAKKRLEA